MAKIPTLKFSNVTLRKKDNKKWVISLCPLGILDSIVLSFLMVLEGLIGLLSFGLLRWEISTFYRFWNKEGIY